MSRVSEIYRKIEADGRDEVFIALRPEADVETDYTASAAGDGPLAGMIVAVKDNIDVAGLPTTAACPGYSYVPQRDSAAVAALRAAGAVVIGKTNLDQFATGLVGTRSPYGAVRDSRRPDYISGGSSSGSAVAVALGYADAALGTDTAGSGRVPAALQGIVGIKPTVDAVSTAGVVPACAGYDCVTVFAGDLGTANRMMSVLGTTGGRAWPVDAPLAAGDAPVLAVPDGLAGLSPAWRDAFDATVARAESLGMTVKSVSIAPLQEAARLLYDGALVALRYAAVGDFIDGASDAAGLDPTVASIIAAAKDIPAHALAADQRRLTELAAEATDVLDGCAGLLLPTVPRHPSIAEVAADPVGVNSELGTFTNFCNLLDFCAVAFPAGTVDDPGGTAQFGVTVFGRAGHDAAAMDIAAALAGEPIVSGYWPESAGVQSIPLAVFGAHLRGQPLEWQLADRGARWSGTISTAPAYRLVELATTPPKPGLLRDSAAGSAIRGEVWRVPAAALGDFLAELPSPMTLGSVELSTGEWIPGFVCDLGAAQAGRPLTVDYWPDR
ncbi:allophanate hydrolase [Jongsikchunia kroppenstedtii]|uniref:allophanate hydrolase n=1 Tax=Jongsikchunia kroppenstedtii TaxID=1121721 RepID=UPI00035CA19E|nr:allophanate hydrolase [Jongsikchunia kroppenstedtii]